MQSSLSKRKATNNELLNGQRNLISFWQKTPGNNSKVIKINQRSATCPICSATLLNDTALTNLHIDACLAKAERNAKRTVVSDFNFDPIVSTLKIERRNDLPGLLLLHNFISEDEENSLLKFCDSSTYMDWRFSSFNGNCFSKYFGVKSQFGLPHETRLVRENDAEKGEHDVPVELFPYIERLRCLIALHTSELSSEFRDFRPNECNINSYRVAEGHYLRPHFDDRTLSGPILMNLSLCGNAKMTFAKPLNPNLPTSAIAAGEFGHTVVVDLPRRCLQLVSGAARWSYTHEIKQGDIVDPRRVSITWRQAGGKKGILSKAARQGEDVTSLLLLRHCDGTTASAGASTSTPVVACGGVSAENLRVGPENA